MLPVTIDRDAAGLRAMKWLIRHCRLHVPATFSPHVTACVSHGCALGKGRNTHGKDIAVALNSFSRQLRLPNVEPVLVEGVMGQIKNNFFRRVERRPAWLRDRTSKVMTLLYGEDAAYLRKVKREGDAQEKRLLTVIRRFLALVDLGADEAFTHWCFVEHDSAEFKVEGKAFGDACCGSEEEALKKTQTAVLDMAFGFAWDVQDIARWLHAGVLIKRFMMLTLTKNLMPRALKDLQLRLSLTDSLERSLVNIIQATPDDIAARGKLTLWRLCRVLTRDGIGQELVILHIANLCVDTLHYEIFGNDGKNRATLMDLADPKASLICKSMASLHEALTTFECGSRLWELLEVVGGDFDSPENRASARRQLISVNIGMEDMFGIPFSGPPYSLAPIAREQLTGDEDDAIEAFFAMNYSCLSLFCQRLRDTCPSNMEMRHAGRWIVRALLLHTPPSTDLSERSNAQLKKDLASSAAAKSPVASANRVMCRSAVRYHEWIGGAKAPCARALLDARRSQKKRAFGPVAFGQRRCSSGRVEAPRSPG